MCGCDVESGMRSSSSDEMADASSSAIPLKLISNHCGVLSLAYLRVFYFTLRALPNNWSRRHYLTCTG